VFQLSTSVSNLLWHISKNCTGRSALQPLAQFFLSFTFRLLRPRRNHIRCINHREIHFLSAIFFWYIVSALPHHSLDEMPVSQDETANSRGWLSLYLHHQVHQLISVLLDQRARRGRTNNQLCLLSPRILCYVISRNCNRSSSLLLNSLLNAFYYHFYSFDMYI
jgi:hypothetical protein